MSGLDADADRPQHRAATGDDATDARDGRVFELHSVVVSYEARPNRCTVYPRRLSCRDRTTSWLSADFDAFVDLADAR